MSRILRVKNYERFQHYKDKRPIWIKVYLDLLRDHAFNALPDAAQLQLIKLWLVAGRTLGELPYDLAYLRREIHAKGRLHVADLITAGWLIVEDSSRQSLEKVYTNSRRSLATRAPARSREVEVEVEVEKNNYTPPARARVEQMLPNDTARTALSELLERTPGKATLLERILTLAGERVSLSGRPSFAWDVVAEAIIELAQTSRPANHLESFCRTVAERRSRPDGSRPDDAVALAGKLFLENPEQETTHAA